MYSACLRFTLHLCSSLALELLTWLSSSLLGSHSESVMDSIVSLLPIWEDRDRVIQWWDDHRLLPSHVSCSACQSPTLFVSSPRGDGWVWRCRRRGCQKRVSVRAGTIFENSKVPISKILQLLYWWAKDMPVNRVAEEVCTTEGTVVDWFLRFRELCASYLLATSTSIGGVGHTVEVDECLFDKRK